MGSICFPATVQIILLHQVQSNDLRLEKIKAESLISSLLPTSVYQKILSGINVEPETFEEVTISFTDIVGFTRIASFATPMEIVALLSDLFFILDSIVINYDVYKVATIGDCYMISSGAPVKNGNKHASCIADMSIDFLKSTTSYPIAHLPGEELELRIGIHTGPCVAGITGCKTPRYLLFGNTVNIANAIESMGKPQNIHISETSAAILFDNENYNLTINKTIEMKGYGGMLTYWLTNQ